MLLTHCNCHDALTNIDEPRFLAIFETFSPASEEAWLEGMLMGASSNGRWFMYFGVATIDLKFLDSGGLLEFGDIKSLHSNDYWVIIKINNAKFKISLLTIEITGKVNPILKQEFFSLIHIEPRTKLTPAKIIEFFWFWSGLTDIKIKR